MESILAKFIFTICDRLFGVNGKRVVLLPGASSGIGKACGELLTGRDLQVYGASRLSELRMDVREDSPVAQAVARIVRREGRIHVVIKNVVVNNAGIAIAGAVEDTSIEEARDQFEVNFFGVPRVCRAVLPAMREQGTGYIVNIGSIGGLVAIPYPDLYSASKFALEGARENSRQPVTPAREWRSGRCSQAELFTLNPAGGPSAKRVSE